MNMPANCPCCKGPLRNDFTATDSLIKTCDKRIDHKFVCYSHKNTGYDIVHKATLLIDSTSRIEACWWFYPKEFAIYNLNDLKKVQWMPWFEPDFSNYKKLMEKVKTYILFS